VPQGLKPFLLKHSNRSALIAAPPKGKKAPKIESVVLVSAAKAALILSALRRD
jgi:hypothetical protein